MAETFFYVHFVGGRFKTVRIIDECFDANDCEIHYEALSMTPDEREEAGLYSASQLGISHDSITNWNLYTSSDDWAEAHNTESYWKHTREIESYWYKMASEYFQPMRRRFAALAAWTIENSP